MAIYNADAVCHLEPGLFASEKRKEGGLGEQEEEEEGGSEVPSWPETFSVDCDGMQRVPCLGALQKTENNAARAREMMIWILISSN